MGAIGKVSLLDVHRFIHYMFSGLFLATLLPSQILKRSIHSVGLIQKAVLRTILSSSHTALVDGKSCQHRFLTSIIEVRLSLKVCVLVSTSQITRCTLASHFSCGLSVLLNDLTLRSIRTLSWTLLLLVQRHLKLMSFPGSKLRS